MTASPFLSSHLDTEKIVAYGATYMITRVSVKSFKSLVDVSVELGQLNVFIGANGSGKSNLLEACGVLSAAAAGRVDDGQLLMRGVRPGVPKLYKSAFNDGAPQSTFIDFTGASSNASYRVTLHNPLKDPSPAWHYKSELWKQWPTGQDEILTSRPTPERKEKEHPEKGLAALESVRQQLDSPGSQLLSRLENFCIFTPTTSVLRGTAPENQPHRPVGLSGGRLPEAVGELKHIAHRDDAAVGKVLADAMQLIDWAEPELTVGTPGQDLLSPAAAASPNILWFRDRYLRKGRDRLSGYDVSEGALYVLFLAVLAAHPQAPKFFAIDNADHGLNPRLLMQLMKSLSSWLVESTDQRQILLTSHNPAVLDGLPLQDERIRLFTVDRDNHGRTVVRRITVDQKLLDFASKGWTLSRLWTNGLLGGVPNV